MQSSYKSKFSKVKKKKDRFVGRDLYHSVFHVSLSQNNVHVSVSDVKGDIVCWSSSGTIGLKNNKKSTPFAAKSVGKDIAEKAIALGVRTADILVKGSANTLEELIRGIASSIRVDSIRDVSPIAFNGTRPRGARRV